MSAIDEEEEREWRDRFRSELEEEDRRRALAVDARRGAAQKRGSAKQKKEREAEFARLRDEVRAEYYLEHGYQLYTDSTGREIWLSPEEYEYRSTRKRRRKRKKRYEIVTPRRQNALYFLGMVAIAVLVGMALVHN